MLIKGNCKQPFIVTLLGTLLLTSQPATATNVLRNPFDLREAIEKAPVYRREKHVSLQQGLYRLAAGTKRIVVKDNLVIVGRGSESENVNSTIIDGGLIDDMIFEVLPSGHLTLVNLAVKNGHNLSRLRRHAVTVEPGGAIYNRGVVTLLGCSLYLNQTAVFQLADGTKRSGNGGAIYNAGVLNMKDSYLWGNACGFAFYGSGGGGGSGGSLYNTGNAFIKHSTIESSAADYGVFGSSANGGDGGGIYNGGYMQIEDSIVDANHSGRGADGTLVANGSELSLSAAGNGGNGGGIYNAGRMIVRRSTVYDNGCGDGGIGITFSTGMPGGNGGNGAGVFNAGSLIIDRSRVLLNSGSSGGNGGIGLEVGADGGPAGNGAGIFNAGMIHMTLCMVAGNSTGHGGYGGAAWRPPFWPPTNASPPHPSRGGTGGSGGGLFNSGTATILANTFTQNSAGAGGAAGDSSNFGRFDGPPGNGGGIFTDATGSTSIANTIVAQNFVTNGTANLNIPGAPDGAHGPDYDGAMVSGGFNLIGADEMGQIAATMSDLIGDYFSPIDPMLTTDRTAFGLDYTPLPGSPAIDKGNSFGLKTDEVGQPRVVDDPATPNAAGSDGADIGACEFDPNWVPTAEQ